MSSLNNQSLALLKSVYAADYFRLKKRFFNLQKISKSANQNAQQTAQYQQKFEQWLKAVEQSALFKQNRANKLPTIKYPELPVSDKRDEIVKTIQNNQVVIIAGETGSGKTTQLPKMCLEAGRGLNGFIGHTQPRRLAARSVATRIAEELESKIGESVGFKVRFNDQTKPESYIKLMTDGILLAEIQQDKFLNQYDTIIIDEAHERSLNIDFILGYLRQLLPRRPDLKVVITSATIDVEKFSKHFNHAPIIEVSGRSYPVEVRYNPLVDEDRSAGDTDSNRGDKDMVEGIIDAVNELCREGNGDILVFLNGEREIRDTADALNKENLRHCEVLPLYARLSASEQNRIFQNHSGRRIVLSTNVAETSLTVPGIRYVIDPGTARISRYSARTKVQRLPIEPISQASANQRSGRCGRVAAGICIRLYSENDFLGRPEFTDPEILRTNLASVILQMHALGLGDIAAFPFLQPPDSRNINDGVNLLKEIGALAQTEQVQTADQDQIKAQTQSTQLIKLTKIGRQVASLPVDPRLGKMVITAERLNCLREICIIVAGLSIQDPRERPSDKQQAADEKHKKYEDKASDFFSLVKLWLHIEQQQTQLSQNQFRKYCKTEFLNYLRIREWQDIVYQISEAINDLGWKINTDEANYQSVHQALLSGLLSHIGNKNQDTGYQGARNSQFLVFPGSALAKTKAKWIMAAELVETSRLFARVVAKIEPEWIEPLAQHLINKKYDEPHWEKKRGSVVAFESQVLYGLTIVHKRRVQYSKIDPVVSREIFIREALVNVSINLKASFLKHNQALIEGIETLEAKTRRRDILADEEDLCEFYTARIPESICDQASFSHWWQQKKVENPTYLNMTEADLMKHEAAHVTKNAFPDIWIQGNLRLPLEYVFEPTEQVDGINLIIPLALINQIEDTGFDWSIPGYRHALIVALIKSLPKSLRRNFVPAPNYADACLQNLATESAGDNKYQTSSLISAVSKQLLRMSGIRIAEDDWDFSQIPSHLRFNFKVVDEKNQVLLVGKDLSALKDKLQGKVAQTLTKVADKGIEQTGLTDFPNQQIPIEYSQKQAGYEIKAFPALVDKTDNVALALFDTQQQANDAMLDGVARMIYLNLPSVRSYLQEKLPNRAKLGLYFNPFGNIKVLIEDCILACIKSYLLTLDELPRTTAAYQACREHLRGEIADSVLETAVQVEKLLSLYSAINKKLKGKTNFELIQAQSDIKQQLSKLIFKGFVASHGVNKLKDVERYLTGIQKRLEKLPIDPVRDRLNRDQIEKVTQDGAQLTALYQTNGTNITQVAQFRWMLEELRISLFAQNLGTAHPISTKRVNQFIQECKKLSII